MRDLLPGEVRWRWSETVRELAVVVEGRLEIARLEFGVRPLRLRLMRPGEIVGFSTVAGEPHTADVIASGPTRVALIPAEALEALIQEEPGVALRMLAALGNLVGTLTDEMGELRSESLATRTYRWLHRNVDPSGWIAITHQLLADHVGATRASVSRVLEELALDGRIDMIRGRIRVHREVHAA